MMNEKEDYIDDKWCPWCLKETKQTIHSDGHERDSSYDYYQCHECGATAYGMSGYRYTKDGQQRDSSWGKEL